MNQFTHLNFDGVVVTAEIAVDGRLKPIAGAFDKLVACVRSTVVPRIHTLVVAEGQREELRRIDPKLLNDNPHAQLVVLIARDVRHMASLLATDAQTRWGRIENYSAELSRHRDFVGRGWLRELVDDFIAAANGGYLLLVGQPGFGKSAFTADIIRRAQCDAFHFVKRGMGDWDDPGTILGSLSAQLRRRFTLPLAAGEEGRTTAAVFNILLHRVSSALPRGQKAVICLDGLDESFGPDGRFARVALPGVLPHPLPANIKVILTSRPGEHLSWLAREDHCRRVDLDRNSAANLADIRGYFERQNTARTLGIQATLIDHLVTASEGCFAAAVLYLLDRRTPSYNELGSQVRSGFLVSIELEACHDIGAVRRSIRVLADLLAGWQKDPATIPRGLDGWLTEEWKRLTTRGKGEPQRWPQFVKSVIGTMALAASPLSRDQLDVIFGTPPRPRSKSIPMDAALRKVVADQLDQVLLRAQQFFDSGGIVPSTHSPYGFFHTRFPEFVKKKLSFAEREACGTFLAAVCATWQHVAEPMRDYVLRYGPRHLTEAKAWDPLETLLTDLLFLEARAKAKLAFELGSDLDTAASSMLPARPRQRILALLGEAVRRDVQFIDRHPTTLLQCLWNSCWWYDCDEAKHHYALPEDQLEGSEAVGPWFEPGEKLCRLLERWRGEKQSADPAWTWVRSMRPPALHLGTAQRAVFRGHESSVDSVSFSPDGGIVASGSKDNTVRLWDARTGREVRVLCGHEHWVTSVSFSPDGRLVASGSWDKTVRLWDAHTGREMRILRGHESPVDSVNFSPDGRVVASGAHKIVCLWDAESGREMRVLRGHEGNVNSVCFSRDGQLVASGSNDGTVRLWDVQAGREVRVLCGHENWVASVSFSPDGRVVASGSSDRTVRLWDAQTGRELSVLRGHENSVRSVSFSPDGRMVASGSWDQTVRLWDSQTGRELGVLYGDESLVESVGFSPDGRIVAGGSDDKTVRLWDVQAGRAPRVLRGHENWPDSVSFSPDGRVVASGANDETVRLWDAQTGRELRVLRGHEGNVNSVCFSPDGRGLATGAYDSTVRLWDAQTGRGLRVLRGHEDSVHSVAFNPNGRVVVSGSDDRTIRLWDAQTGRKLRVLRKHEGHVGCVRFNPDGKVVASMSADKTVRLWDAHTGRELRVLRGHESHVSSVSFSPDSRVVASGSFDNTVRLWDPQTGRELHVLRGHKGNVDSVSFSPDGRVVASGSSNETMRWDVGTGERLEVMQGSADSAAVAAGADRFPWRPIVHQSEMVIELAADGSAVAWFPQSLRNLNTHASGTLWTASASSQLVLIRLEGTRR